MHHSRPDRLVNACLDDVADGGRWAVDGGWWMVDGGWWMVDSGRRTADSGQRTTGGGRRTADGRRRTAGGGGGRTPSRARPSAAAKPAQVDMQRRAPPAAEFAAERAPDYHTNYDNQRYLIKGGGAEVQWRPAAGPEGSSDRLRHCGLRPVTRHLELPWRPARLQELGQDAVRRTRHRASRGTRTATHRLEQTWVRLEQRKGVAQKDQSSNQAVRGRLVVDRISR